MLLHNDVIYSLVRTTWVTPPQRLHVGYQNVPNLHHGPVQGLLHPQSTLKPRINVPVMSKQKVSSGFLPTHHDLELDKLAIERDSQDPHLLANLNRLGPVRVDHHMQAVRLVSLRVCTYIRKTGQTIADLRYKQLFQNP